jgi:hypothetical protein
MKNRVLVLSALVLTLTLALLAPKRAASLVGSEVPGYAGEVTNYIDGICYWHCYSGSVGSAPASTTRQCMNLCSNACFGGCIAMY